MTTVSSLVVQRRLATLRQVEEALARQALFGGDVVTNLLEVAPPPATDEAALTRALADALQIEPASAASMRAPDAAAVAKVARPLAEEHAIIPVALVDGALVVALAEPLSEASLATLQTKIGAPIRQVAAPLFRLRQALELAYGLPMDRRTRRLVAKLEGRESMTPPPSSLGSELGGVFAHRDLDPDPLARKLPSVPPSNPSHGQGAQLEAARAKSNRPPPATTIRASNPGPQALQWFLRNAGAAERASAPNPVVIAPAAIPAAIPRPGSEPRVRAPIRKRRGPFTRTEAEEVLTEATSADAAFAAFFEFAQQYVTYAALFLVKEDLAEGFDAHGPGASADRVRKMGVPLDLPSFFAAARDDRMPVLRRGARDGMDAVIASDLDRAQEGHMVVLPVVVGKRVVALLYGDDAKETMSLADLGDVLAIGTLTGAALARIIVRRKNKAVPGGHAESEASSTKSATPSERPYRAERPSLPGVAERARALATALTARKKSIAPAPAPANPQPTMPATPQSMLDVGARPSARPITAPPPTPRPYATTSDRPVPSRFDLDAPPSKQTIPAMPAVAPGAVKATISEAPSADSAAASSLDDEPPQPARPRQTDPYGIEMAKGAPPSGRHASLARIELRTIQAELARRVLTDIPPGLERAPAMPALEPVAAPTTEPPDRPEPRAALVPPPDDAPTPAVDVPEVRAEHDEAEPMPLSSAMPMPPPPAFAARRSLAAPIPREEPTPGAEATDHVAPIELATPAFEGTDSSGVIETADVTDDELEELLELAAPPMREGERLEAYPPRPPPRPQPVNRLSEQLPKVIVALDPDMIVRVERLLRGGEAGEVALRELRESGLAAVPAIMDRFPGPTRHDRLTPLSQLAKPADVGPIFALLAQLGRVVLRDVLARLGDPSPDARFWATYLLTEIVDPEAAPALVPRLVDDDLAVRRVAALAARTVLQRAPSAASALVDPLVGVLLDPGAPPALRSRAAAALGEVRDARAVEGLILGIESYDRDVGAACHDSLVTITRHDPRMAGQTWPSWFSKHKQEHRIEWLIDALLDEAEPLRDAAATELKALTKQYFGYYANLPRPERETAQARYRTWWDAEGRAKLAQ